jgi:hypothetical protein
MRQGAERRSMFYFCLVDDNLDSINNFKFRDSFGQFGFECSEESDCTFFSFEHVNSSGTPAPETGLDKRIICELCDTSLCIGGKCMVADSLPTLGDKATFVPFQLYYNIAGTGNCGIPLRQSDYDDI